MKNISELNITNNGVESDTLLIALHGTGGDGDRFMNSISEVDNVTVIAPTTSSINEAGKAMWDFQNPEREAWEIRGMIEDLVSNYGYDINKIHICGTSAGGTFALNVANMFPDLFKSVIVICGQVTFEVSQIESDVTILFGDEDKLLDYTVALNQGYQILKDGGANVNFMKIGGGGHLVNSLNSHFNFGTIGGFIRDSLDG